MSASKFYVVFETYALCHKGTTEPMGFDTQEDCQRYIDNNCDPREFPQVEFIETDDAADVLKYVARKGAK
ncbi:MAG TPA: hypothetical protein VEH27_00750 [Methylomirabilota bacterium]|nr:hypothetical protein [Methylomirabilota bacterium]